MLLLVQKHSPGHKVRTVRWSRSRAHVQISGDLSSLLHANVPVEEVDTLLEQMVEPLLFEDFKQFRGFH